jgi:hypothetical protein
MNKQIIFPVLIFMIIALPLFGQDQDLMDLFKDEDVMEEPEYATNTFFATRVISGQSIENPFPGDLIFVISHHFGRLNQGAYDFWGLDQATIRLGFDYGVNDRLAISVGRSSFEKTYDGFFKYKVLRQQSGLRNVPVTLTWFSGAYLKSQRWINPERDYLFAHRISYVHQILIARRFSRTFSFQLSPAWIHKNLAPHPDDPNDHFVLGMGGRIRLTDWVALSGEYFHQINKAKSENFYNAFAIGFDFDTGGHVFQLHFTNAQPMFERGFLTETRGNWLDGDIYFGFNIVRVFGL